jgi:hypothetical protein
MARDFSLHHIRTDSEASSVSSRNSFHRNEWSRQNFEWLPSTSAAKACSELNCNALPFVWLHGIRETLSLWLMYLIIKNSSYTVM